MNWLRRPAALVFLPALLLFGGGAAAQGVALDPTFGEGGLVVTDVAGGPDGARAVAVQSDGRVLVAGRAFTGSDLDVALARYEADGSLDPSFGDGGLVTTDFGGTDDQALGLVVLADGRIVVVGGAASSGAASDVALARYSADGALDPTFGDGGLVTTDFGGGFDQAHGVAVQTDGKLVVGGWATAETRDFGLARYEADGSLDLSFGDGGRVTTEFFGATDWVQAVAVQPDGKIVAAGGANAATPEFALARYEADGSLDLSFGDGGRVTTDFGGDQDWAYGLAVQPDGKLVVAGRVFDGGHDFGLARYEADGSLDLSFGDGGRVTTDFGGGNDKALALLPLPTGEVVLAGWANEGGGSDLALAQYRADGALDEAFGTDGRVVTDVGGSLAEAYAITGQPDGRLVVAGRVNSGGGDDLAVGRYAAGPATYTWTGAGGDGLWTTPGNWSPTGVPGDGDSAVISSGAVTLSAGQAVGDVALSGGGIRGPGSLTVGGAYTQTAGTYEAGDLAVAGPFSWSGGAIRGAGALATDGGVALGRAGAGSSFELYGRALTLSGPGGGAATWEVGPGGASTLYLGDGAELVNPAGHTLALDASAGRFEVQRTGPIATEPALTNAGTLRVAGGGGLRVDVEYANGGSIEVEGGSLRLFGGGASTGAIEASAGAVAEFIGGAHAVSGSYDAAGAVTRVGGSGVPTVVFEEGLALGSLGALEVVRGTLDLRAPGAVETVEVMGTSAGALVLTPDLAVPGDVTLGGNRESTITGPGSLTVGGAYTQTAGTYEAGDLAVAGPFSWSGGAIRGAGALATDGGVALGRAGAGSSFELYGRALTLSGPGGGAATWEVGPGGASTLYLGDGAELVNPAGHTLALDASAGRFEVQRTGPIATEPALTNAGTLRVAGGGGLRVDVEYANGGVISLDGSSLRITRGGGAFENAAGATLGGDGLLTLDPGSPFSNAGTLAPGLSGATGRLDITASTFPLEGSGQLEIELGGTEPATGYDRLAVDGAVALGGTLAVSTLGGFVVEEGQSFEVLTYTSRTGAFETVTASGLPPELALVPAYADTGLTLTAVARTFDCADRGEVARADCDALVALYGATGGDGWANNAGWLDPATPVSEWYGVGLGAGGRVEALDLAANGLDGPLPAAIGALTGLRTLRLQSNTLTGPIPPEIGALTSLESALLFLNDLTGEIPTEIGDLAALETLGLGENRLSGALPAELGRLGRLRQLDVNGNALSGPLPEALGALGALTSLVLDDNAFTGPIPLTFVDLVALERFVYTGTDLCEPDDDAFRSWLGSVATVEGTGVVCSGGGAGPEPGTCAAGSATAVLEANDVQATLFNTGALFGNGDGWSRYVVPRDRGVPPLFAAGTWLGGTVGGEVRTAASRYGATEWWPGPLAADGRPPDPADCSAHDRMYRVSLGDVAAYEATGVAAPDLAAWPVGLGAPAVDAAGRPVEAASPARVLDLAAGERPVLFGDQSVFWVMNDVGNVHEETGTPPIGLEVRATAFAVASADPALDQATLYRYEVVNRGEAAVDDARLGVWVDADLGGASDDYVGSDPARGLAFTYNADDVDDAYGTPPPAVGVDVLSGAEAVAYFENTPSGPTGDPRSGAEYANALRGLWRDGTPMTEGGNGYDTGGAVTAYAFPGDPESRAFWSEVNTDGAGGTSAPRDRRLLVSAAPVTLAPGAATTVDFAVVFAQGTDHLHSVTALKAASDALQAQYDRGDLYRARTAGAVSPDSLALVALYDATGGPDWSDNTNWLTGPLGTWRGVTLDADRRVVSLQLNDNGLAGPLPAALGDLDRLRELRLANNGLTGAIPAEIVRLTDLRVVQLNTNALTGEIPAAIGDLAHLEQLTLFLNDLTGTIPTSIGELSQLTSLGLGENGLTGAIPTEIGRLTNLEQFDINGNPISGSLPEAMGDLVSLQSLIVNDTDLDGPIPLSFVDLAALATFRYSGTGLCAPPDDAFEAWLSGVATVEGTGVTCSANAPPGAIADIATTTEGVAVLVDLLANDTDADGDTLAVASVTDPARGAAEVLGRRVLYTPDDGFVGVDAFTYTASDGRGGTDTAEVTVTVEAGGPLAVFFDRAAFEAAAPGLPVEGFESVADTWAPRTGCSPVLDVTTDDDCFDPGDLLEGVQYGGVSDSSESFSYMVVEEGAGPWDGRALLLNNIYARTVIAFPDGGATALGLDVYNFIDGPTHFTLTLYGLDDEVLRVLPFRYDGSYAFVGMTSEAPVGWAVLNEEPAWAEGNRASEVIDNVAFRVVDAGGNAPPVAAADGVETTGGASVFVDVLANDGDPDGDALTIASVTEPANGTVRVQAPPDGGRLGAAAGGLPAPSASEAGGAPPTSRSDGPGLWYRPRRGFTGTDTFTYAIRDGAGGTAEGVVTVTVGPLPAGTLPALTSPNPQPVSSASIPDQSVAGVEDVTGDGAGDVVVGLRHEDGGAPEAGRAYVYDGADGTPRGVLESPNPEAGGRFGQAVAGVPDVDGDGVGDLVVGAPYEEAGGRLQSGRAYVFSGATLDLVRALEAPSPETGARFGFSVAGVPDLTGDGRGEVFVGTIFGDAAFVVDGTTGEVVFALAPPAPTTSHTFGSTVSAVPDADGDGVPDLLVGDRGATLDAPIDGRVHLFSGATGGLLRTFESPSAETDGGFGVSVTGVDDVDGDGRGDLLVGASLEDGAVADEGRAYLFSGATGGLLRTLIPAGGARGFGHAVAAVPGLGGGGRSALLVGAPAVGGDGGRAFLFDGDGALLVSIESPDAADASVFGHAVAGVPDADGDGRGEVLVDDPFARVAGTPVGRAYLLSVASNRAPVAADDAVETEEGVAVVVDVLANDGDPDGDALTIASVGAPASGTAVAEGAAVRYTPAAGFTGTDTFPYAVDDGNGGSAEATVTVAVVARVVTVTADVMGTPEAGAPAAVEVAVAGMSPTVAELRYRPTGAAAFAAVPLVEGAGGAYEAAVPAAAMTLRGAEYYVFLSDGDRTVTVPAEDPEAAPVRIRVAVPTAAASVSFPAGGAYRMVTVPVDLADAGPGAVLADDYGPYDPARWRLLRWRPAEERYAEYPDLGAPLAPGVGVWLIADGGFDVDDGLSVDPAVPAVLRLEPGWNQVGSPFAFPVAWASVGGAEGLPPPAAWDGAEYDLDVAVLEPWVGYFVENPTDAPVEITVPPVAADGGRLAPDGGRDTTLAYRLGLRAEAGAFRDTRNAVGFASDAAAGRDAYDRAEPPPPGEHVRLSVVADEGPDGLRLARSVVPDDGSGAAWDLEVAATPGALARGPLGVRVALDEAVPPPGGYGRHVLDLDRGAALALDDDAFGVTLTPDAPVRRYRLIVGTEAFARAAAGGLSLEPAAFALDPPAPNPSRGPIAVGYALAERGPATLEVLDLLGRRVAVLATGEHGAGPHVATLDTAGLAGGVYVVRLRAGPLVATRKVAVLR